MLKKKKKHTCDLRSPGDNSFSLNNSWNKGQQWKPGILPKPPALLKPAFSDALEQGRCQPHDRGEVWGETHASPNRQKRNHNSFPKPDLGLVVPPSPYSARADFRVEVLGHEVEHWAGRGEFKSVIKEWGFWLPGGFAYAVIKAFVHPCQNRWTSHCL